METRTRTVHFPDHERWDISMAVDSSQLIFVPSYDASKKFSIDLRELLTILKDRYPAAYEYASNTVPQDLMMISSAHDKVRLQLFLRNITVNIKKKHIALATLSTDIIMTTK
jgi:hypothetical protein